MLLVGGAIAVAYAVLLTWPVHIWARPVSPNTHVVGTFGIDGAGALRYVAIVALLFGLYAGALWLLSRGARPRFAVVVALGALPYALLCLTHPLSSTDLFNYIAGARIGWVHHANPLTTAPTAFPDDRFVLLVNNWRDLPSPYGPLWSLVAGLPLALGGNRYISTLVAFKVFASVCLLGAALLAALTAERLRPGTRTLAFVTLAWNPLVVWHVAGNGHNDAVLALPLALAAWLLARGLAGPAMVALTAAALVKFVPLLLVPLLLVWWWRNRATYPPRWRAPWLGAALALAVAAYAPFWAGAATFRTSLDEGSYFTVSSPAAIRGALLHVTGISTAETIAGWGSRAVFLALYAVIAWRVRTSVAALLAAGAAVLTCYLVVASTYFAPWYVIWPLTLAACVPWRRAIAPILALSLSAMSVLLWATWVRVRYGPVGPGDWYPMHLLAAVCIVGPALLIWLSGRGRGSADIETPSLQGEIAGTRSVREDGAVLLVPHLDVTLPRPRRDEVR